jgi:hypothetical protein
MRIAPHIIGDCAAHGEDVPTMEACIEQTRLAALDGGDRCCATRTRTAVRFADAVGAMFSQKTGSNVHVRAPLQQWYLEGPCVGPCESDRI